MSKNTEKKQFLNVDRGLMKQIAASDLAGFMSKAEIARQFNLSHHAVAKILKSDEYNLIKDRLSDAVIAPALKQAKISLSALLKQAIKVVKKHLEEDNLEAAKLVFKSMGIGDKEDEKGDTAITVILPGSEAPKEVQSDIVMETNNADQD